jgi:death-on-curing protein
MKYLTSSELVAINKTVVQLSGGSHGVREKNLLESIAVRPQSKFNGEELYPDIFTKAAVVFESLINFHVFVDGNKRTALASLARFLHVNGYTLFYDQKEMVEFTLQIANTNPDIEDVAKWIKKHSKKL